MGQRKGWHQPGASPFLLLISASATILGVGYTGSLYGMDAVQMDQKHSIPSWKDGLESTTAAQDKYDPDDRAASASIISTTSAAEAAEHVAATAAAQK
ncbi:MAG: hypothetical protein K2J67_01705 [Lachnospiraceae bacterium]|nr:hypothetical protein [Lachnospiraceae bacterium]